IIDGRYHTPCRHFVSIATRHQDCLRANCIFSRRHPFQCKSPACIRMMGPPVRNPIRVSDLVCPECISRERNGTLGLP
ncbi:hypothetical protein HETIRDRAFT_309285, partial [Heterobasidion irregulare TC 32-1]